MSRRSIVLAAVVAVALAALAGGAWWLAHRTGEGGGATAASAARYYCPMHPTMISDRPGDCPVCYMRLVPMEEPEPAAPPADGADAPGGGKRVIYRSTMNPNEVSDTPGLDSMGMEMVAVEVDEGAPAGAPAVPGLASVRIAAPKRQLIGVETSPVARARFRRSIRTVGRVTVDETRLQHVHTKVAGYVERLYTNATGEPVEQGQPMLEFYSPELLATQEEYLVALKARNRAAGGGQPALLEAADDLVRSARRRLELFDVPDEEVLQLQRSGQARRTLTFSAPISGVILRRNVTQGERVEAGTTLLELADLSRVWVMAAVYEYELPFVRQGQQATMTLSYLPGRTFEGRVSLVYPTLDPATRTVQVRLEFANPDGELKPDMYAEVELLADLGERLALPTSALLETGTRRVVFVDRGEGLFEPREVEIGLRLPDLAEILRGVADGERVLTSGNFFVDSESKLQAALQATAGAPAPPEHRH
jgi:RND family efflux transporter MFP subunit